MKLEVYESKKEKKDETVRVMLNKEDEDIISLIAVDERGQRVPCGCLLFIHSDGTFERASAVNPKLGFQLSEERRIKEKIK